MTELDIWLNDILVARTKERDRGRKLTIVYDKEIVASVRDETPLLSCSLPTPGPSKPAPARAFLEGLLPEGRALETMAANLRGVQLRDGAPATAADGVALLAEYGRDCAGAVATLPSGMRHSPGRGTYQALTDADLASTLRDLQTRPLGADLDRDVRMSLAGAQPKFLLARFEGAWFEPIDGAASTHILKPTTRWENSAENEALVMELARRAGLSDRPTWVEHIEGTSVFVAERYDRSIDGDQVVRRHQEDLCQALGIRPVDKYLVGRPSSRMARLLRREADSPTVAVNDLFKQVVFRVVIGDEDGHGKNYSLLLDNGRVRLAPMYDSLCTLIYPELSGKMGAAVGAQTTLANVDRAALLEEAVAMGLLLADATITLDDLAANLRGAVAALDSSLTSGWLSERVIDIVRSRLDHLESGKPLGEGTHQPPRRTVRRTQDMTVQTIRGAP